jgi:hypothetical protein
MPKAPDQTNGVETVQETGAEVEPVLLGDHSPMSGTYNIARIFQFPGQYQALKI